METNIWTFFCLKCINCRQETGLNSETTFTWFYDKFITKFVLNVMLHNVGMSWIISSNQEMEYDMTTKSNNLDCSNKGPWYGFLFIPLWNILEI